MEMQGFQFVDAKKVHDNYRVFLKNSTFIGNYTEWEALLVANAIERALAAQYSAMQGDLFRPAPVDHASLSCFSTSEEGGSRV